MPGPPPDPSRSQPLGLGSITLSISGELGQAGSPSLEEALSDAVTKASLVIVDLHQVTSANAAGAKAFVGPAAQARRTGGRLVVVRASPDVRRLLEAAGALDHLHVLSDAPLGAGPERVLEPGDDARMDPLANPVNERVVIARTMTIEGSWLWLHDEYGEVRRAWAPPDVDYDAMGSVEVYLNADGEVNGWRSPTAQLAVNQRALNMQGDPPTDAHDLICQDACGITWLAPAAQQVASRGEGCLTCGGTLALAP